MDINNIKTYKLIIKGKVQDVGFRQWFSNLAISYELNGYIKNLINRNIVEATIQGNKFDILKITEKSKVGPKLALVEKVISKEIFKNVQYSEFKVEYEN